MIVLKIESKKEKSKIILPKIIYTTSMSKIKKITIITSIMIRINIVSLKKILSKLLFYIPKKPKLSNKVHSHR